MTVPFINKLAETGRTYTLPNSNQQFTVANSTPSGVPQQETPFSLSNFLTTPTNTQPVETPSVPVTQAKTPVVQPQTQPQPVSTQQPSISPEALAFMEQYRVNKPSGSDSLYEQWMRERNSNTGMFAIPQGVSITPEQMMAIRRAADQYYSGALSNALEKEKSMTKSSTGYGTDSILAGLSNVGASRVNKLTDAYDSHPIVKNFNTVQSSVLKAQNIMNDIKTRPGAEPNAGDDMSLMYLFAKAQDPESVVRESEYENVASYFSSLPQNVKYQLSRYYQPLPDGRLSPQSREAIFNGLNNLYKSQQAQLQNLRNETIRKINDVAGKDVGGTLLTNYETAYSTSPQVDGDSAFDW